MSEERAVKPSSVSTSFRESCGSNTVEVSTIATAAAVPHADLAPLSQAASTVHASKTLAARWNRFVRILHVRVRASALGAMTSARAPVLAPPTPDETTDPWRMCKDEDEQLMNAFDATCTNVSNVRTREDDEPPLMEDEDKLGPSTIDTAPDPPTPPTALLVLTP